MPKMTGTEHLRQDDRYYRTPIIFMTAMSRDLDIPKLQDELGLAAFFAKPFSPAKLVP